MMVNSMSNIQYNKVLENYIMEEMLSRERLEEIVHLIDERDAHRNDSKLFELEDNLKKIGLEYQGEIVLRDRPFSSTWLLETKEYQYYINTNVDVFRKKLADMFSSCPPDLIEPVGSFCHWEDKDGINRLRKFKEVKIRTKE